MNAEHNLDLIDLYFRNELTGEDLILFEKRLRSDPWFLQEVEQQRKIIQVIKETEILEILRKTHRQIGKEKTVKTQRQKETDFSERTVFAMKNIRRSGETVNPLLAMPSVSSQRFSIAYEGDPNPPFPIKLSSGKALFEYVQIDAGSRTINYHYNFIHIAGKAILFLYGKFNPKDLTLIYHKKDDQHSFKIRVKTQEYSLKINLSTNPLL